MMNVKNTFLIFATAMALSSQAFAGGVRTSCFVLDKDGAKVEGVNLENMYEIASVSKVFTSYWATRKLGLDYRFKTKFHVTPVDSDTVNIHIEGGMDPLFSAWQMQYVIAEMNKLNIKKVKELSFDERFVFIKAARTGHAVHGNITPDSLAVDEMKAQLTDFMAQIHFGYENFKTRLDKTVKIDLPAKLTFSVESIAFVKKEDFQANDKTLTYMTKSLPLHMILKEMNRMSNNWAANAIFESLGSAKGFKAFMLKDLELGDKQISFINGSGDSWQKSKDSAKLYNKATCGAILATTSALSEAASKQGMSLDDIMAVAGEERNLGYGRDETGTVAGGYSNELTTASMIAKTGTVNPSVALAGTVETQDGRIYFGYVYLPSARAQLRLDLLKLIKTHHGKDRIEDLSKLKMFSMIDSEAALQRVNSPTPTVKPAAPAAAPKANPEAASELKVKLADLK